MGQGYLMASDIDEIMNRFLGPTGIPDRLRAANQIFNPVEAVGQSMTASREMLAPGRTGWQRAEAAGNMLSGVAGFAAPMVAASRAGAPAANALVETFTGYSPTRNALADFATDEDGALRLYHGSPHDFDRFSMDKIGTGEGAQAYGHGLYFAESEGVARSYRDALARPTIDGVPVANIAGPRAASADDALLASILSHEKTYQNARFRLDRINRLDLVEKLDEIKARGGLGNEGRMYEVNVNANPEDFLDWDAPLSAQTGSAKKALDDFLDWYAGPDGKQEIYDAGIELGDVQNQFDDLSPQQFASAMRARGVPGSKYRDAGSRGRPGGLGNDETRNYVVFDDKLIEILRKYGVVPGAVSLNALAAQYDSSTGQPMAQRPPRVD